MNWWGRNIDRPKLSSVSDFHFLGDQREMPWSEPDCPIQSLGKDEIWRHYERDHREMKPFNTLRKLFWVTRISQKSALWNSRQQAAQSRERPSKERITHHQRRYLLVWARETSTREILSPAWVREKSASRWGTKIGQSQLQRWMNARVAEKFKPQHGGK